jgi:23S rRNA pseudouridine1911/1915/1917 synthase
MEPAILFEDADLVVVDKPAGMIVHPDGKHDYPALDAWLREKYGEIFLVHRIDRETSGVLAVARNEKTYEHIKQQFKDRSVRKTYRAFVHGNFKDERGIIDRAIGSARGGLGPRSARDPYGTTRDAVTMYKRLQNGDGVAYIEVFPKTGRTHQIRVHMAGIGHPIVADRLYGPGRPSTLGFDRLALHALSLSLTHPKGGDMTFSAPLPADFVAAEGAL